MRLTRETLQRMKSNGYDEWVEKQIPEQEQEVKRKEFSLEYLEQLLKDSRDSLARSRKQLEEYKEELRIMEELD
jgi:hypothetical protein